MKNLINAKLLNNLWRDGISPLKNSLADKLGVARVLKTTEEFEANTDENNIPSATLMKVKLNSLDSKIQSFENTKSEIASSGLGVALGLATTDKWATIVDKLIAIINQGAINVTMSTSGEIYTIPVGFHNGSGKVMGPSLSELIGDNVSLVDAASLLSGVTAYGKNGIKYTGTIENKGSYSKWFTPSSSQQSVTLPEGYYTGGTIGCYAKSGIGTIKSKSVSGTSCAKASAPAATRYNANDGDTLGHACYIDIPIGISGTVIAIRATVGTSGGKVRWDAGYPTRAVWFSGSASGTTGYEVGTIGTSTSSSFWVNSTSARLPLSVYQYDSWASKSFSATVYYV